MDPNTALQRIRNIIEACKDAGQIDSDHGPELLETFEALDSWLSDGGFLPEAWERAHP